MKRYWLLLSAFAIVLSTAPAAPPEIDGISGASYKPPPSVPRSRTEILEEIEIWLQKHWLMSVATTQPDGGPHVSGVVYWAEGHTIYFVAEYKTNKIRNIQRDPRVAYTVWDPVDDINRLKALQVLGTASILEGEERDRVARNFAGAPFTAADAVVAVKPVTARWTDKSRAADFTDVIQFADPD